MNDDDISERACPLLAVRMEYDDELGEHIGPHLVACGAPLYVHYDETRAFLMCGEFHSAGPAWQVVCEVGHVLVLPDDEGNDNVDQLPFDEGLVDSALARTRAEP